MKTLVVDDSSTIRRIVRQTLEARLGCQVRQALHGRLQTPPGEGEGTT